MSTLAEHSHNYLTVRRALGFKLVGEGVLLAEFVACAEHAGQHTITTEFALAWARRPVGGSRNYLSRRLRAVRSFARYLHALDPACEIPPLELLPASKYRPAPYLYSDEEILAVMTAAGALHPPLRAVTFRTIIGLLTCSRPSRTAATTSATVVILRTSTIVVFSFSALGGADELGRHGGRNRSQPGIPATQTPGRRRRDPPNALQSLDLDTRPGDTAHHDRYTTSTDATETPQVFGSHTRSGGKAQTGKSMDLHKPARLSSLA
jgi:hypothetical protein